MMMSNNLYSKEIMNSEMFDIENDQYIETPWSIIESYFSGQQLERFVRHQLESYNNFVNPNNTPEMADIIKYIVVSFIIYIIYII